MPKSQNDPVTEIAATQAVVLPTATFTLSVVEGPDRGKSWTIDGRQPSRLLLGQSAVCDWKLNDARVSRRHAALESSDRRLRITDLGSTNGTVVDGVQIVEAFLRGGEEISIGSTRLRVTVDDRSAEVTLPAANEFGRVVGSSVAMRRLYPLCARLAASDVPILIEGETGTGKEVLAESLHEKGARAERPFVVFDCTAVAGNLLEAALFGHEKGAFTGAVERRRGAFELADGGTLFIDEIGELAPELQPKLLRAIERGEVQRVGGDRWTKVDVRIIAATRRDLDVEVQEGRFRDDLFYRLAVTRIELPPLRRRDGDVALLAEHFWKKLGGPPPLPAELRRRLESCAWPGNVRELHNAVARHLALGDLAAEWTPAPPPAVQPDATNEARTDPIEAVLDLGLAYPRARERVIEEFTTRYVERLVSQHGGNVTRAASESGVGLRYFHALRARARRK